MTKLIKNRDGNFTHVKNDIFESGLSAKAMGLFMYMWHLPDNWKFYEDELVKHFKDGKSSVRSGLKELQDSKFLVRKQIHDEKTGKITSYDWQLNESPLCDFPKVDNPRVDKPILENRTLLSTKSTKYLNNKVDDDDDSKPQKLNPFDWYYKAFGNHPNGIVIQDFMNDIDQLGAEVVVEAIKRAGSRSKGWNYAQGMLNRWSKENVKSIADIARLDKQHQSSEQRSFKRKSSAKKKVESYGQGEYAIEKAKADRGEIPF